MAGGPPPGKLQQATPAGPAAGVPALLSMQPPACPPRLLSRSCLPADGGQPAGRRVLGQHRGPELCGRPRAPWHRLHGHAPLGEQLGGHHPRLCGPLDRPAHCRRAGGRRQLMASCVQGCRAGSHGPALQHCCAMAALLPTRRGLPARPAAPAPCPTPPWCRLLASRCCWRSLGCGTATGRTTHAIISRSWMPWRRWVGCTSLPRLLLHACWLRAPRPHPTAAPPLLAPCAERARRRPCPGRPVLDVVR